MLLLVALGISSGLPLALGTDALSAWLTQANWPPSRIGLLVAMAGWPYVVKPLWSPLADRFGLPQLGRRRSWILGSQLLLVLICLAISFTPLATLPSPHANPPRRIIVELSLLLLALGVASASQDTAIDAWRTDTLSPVERAPGAAVFVAGYRLGMILSGAATLSLVGRGWLSWPAAWRWCGAVLSVGVAASLLAKEPRPLATPRSLAEAVVNPLREMLERRNGAMILLFVLVFKAPEFVAASMSQTFLLRSGFSMALVGNIRNGLGIGITIFGALLGGGIVTRCGLWRSLWVFAVLHSVSNCGFAVLAVSGRQTWMLIGAIGVENLCVGLTTAGFIAWLMSQCDSRYSAFQFALLTGVMAMGRSCCGLIAGELAQYLAWPTFFVVSAMFGLPGLAMLPWMQHQRALDGSTVAEGSVT